MIDQCNIPSTIEDHDCFKRLSAKEKMSMKKLFHEWLMEYLKKEDV